MNKNKIEKRKENIAEELRNITSTLKNKNIAYHGTNKKYDTFDPKYMGSNYASLFGIGVYLTTDIEQAKTFGKYIHTYDVSDMVFLDQKGAYKVAEKLGVEIDNTELGLFDQLVSMLDYDNPKHQDEPENTIKELGYDGLKITGKAGSKIKPGEYWYIIYNVDKLKEIK